jgi:hypothetical protein
MKIIETEAKNKRCCGPDGCGEQRHGNPEVARWCIGSLCMAWRKVDQIGIGPDGKLRDRDLDGRTKWVYRGYCGLAGVG